MEKKTTNKLFCIRGDYDWRSSFTHKNYVALHEFTNLGAPAQLHLRNINQTFFNGSGDSNLYTGLVSPPNITDDVTVDCSPAKITNSYEVVGVSLIRGNSGLLKVVNSEGYHKDIFICLCSEDHYNILRIADLLNEEYKKKSCDIEITLLVNGDYCYLSGGLPERGFSTFKNIVFSIDPTIQLDSTDSVNKNIPKLMEIWEKNKHLVLKDLNQKCLSSEENMFMYTNLYDILKFYCSDHLYVRRPSQEGVTMKEFNNIPEVVARNIFCGTNKFTEDDYRQLIGKYPLLWKPEVSRHFAKGELIYVNGAKVFTNYKYELLDKKNVWDANAIYAVGPMWFNRDYDDEKQIGSFVEEYNKLIKNIVCSKPVSTLSKSNYDPKKERKSSTLVASVIGGRFQIGKLFFDEKNHSNENIKKLIRESKDKNNENSKAATIELNRHSDEFTKKMRLEHLVNCFIKNLPNSRFDRVFLSVTPGEYEFFGKKITVNPLSGPDGSGTPFLSD